MLIAFHPIRTRKETKYFMWPWREGTNILIFITQYFGLGPFDRQSFPRASLSENCSLLGTDNVRGQICEHIFAPNKGYYLYILFFFLSFFFFFLIGILFFYWISSSLFSFFFFVLFLFLIQLSSYCHLLPLLLYIFLWFWRVCSCSF